MIKYTKNVAWLEEYVNSVSDIVSLDKIKKIKGYKVKLGLKESQEAAVHTANNAATKFIITIKLYDQELINNQLNHDPLQLARILDSLAHELAHVVNENSWDHTLDHYKYQYKIMLRFIKIMKKHEVNDTWSKFTEFYSD